MPLLHEPVISLEGVKIRALSLSNLDLDILIRVENKNPVGVTLREIPFIVMIREGERQQEIANGNTGSIRIPARDSTVISVPVTSHNAALIRAMVAFFARGKLEVTIKGTAVVDAVVTGWPVLFEKTVAITAEQVADAVAGKTAKNQDS
jgi:LEA14-like dessication related protein